MAADALTAQLPSAATAESAKEAVENALDNDDIAPLVRLIFASRGANSRGSSGSGGRTQRDRSGSSEGAWPQEGAAAGEAEEEVLTALEVVVLEQSSQITNTCRGNADDIGGSILELGSMQGWARGLKARLLPANRQMQEAGSSYSKKLEELQHLMQIQESLSTTRQAVADAQKLLALCRRAGHALQEGALFSAHGALQRLQVEHFQEWSTTAEKARAAGVHIGAREEGILSGLGALQPYLISTAEDLSTALQQRAIADLNNWLVHVRAEARDIGRRAVRRAAAQRALESLLIAERQAVAAALAGKKPDLATAAAAVVSKSSARAMPAATRAAAGDITIEVMGGVDMAPLFRCIEVHARLGRMVWFLDYYRSNRRLQLNADLVAPAAFLDHFQSFVSQLVGFFIVEDRVQRGVEELTSGLQLDAGWESASACLKAALEGAFSGGTVSATLLAAKDFVLLACTALGPCGYHVGPLQEVLLAGRTKYQELLAAKLSSLLAAALRSDPLLRVQISAAALGAELVCTLGLPLNWTAIPVGPTQLPLQAPFSTSVPKLLRLARGYVEDSAAYSVGLYSSSEAVPAARQQQDTSLKRILAESLQAQLLSASQGPDALLRTAQATANAACLVVAVPALEQLTVLRARGILVSSAAESDTASSCWRPPVRLDSAAATVHSARTGGDSVLLAAMRAVQITGERFLISMISSKASTAITGAKSQNWEPEMPPRSTGALSAWMKQLIASFQDLFVLVLKMLPIDAAEHILRATLKDASTQIVSLFVDEDGVRQYNMFALYQLHTDVGGLTRFADSQKDLPGLQEDLLEAVQFCELFVVGHPEDAVDPSKRAQYFSALNMDRLIVALRRYREVDQPIFGRGPQLPKDLVKRKTVEGVIKKLKAMAAESSANVHSK